jgi:phosphate transport system protein
MTRELLEQRISHLQQEVLHLGITVEQSVLDVVAALRRRDTAVARRIEAQDREINEHRFGLEDECLTLIATQQPMARDLRLLAAVLEIITELERMGDYAKGIAHIILMLGPEPLPPDLLDHFDKMASIATRMLHKALEAFVAGDDQAARTIPDQDDEVDSLYNLVYRELVAQMIRNPEAIDHATHLLWVAHNLERLADRVTNICERTIFMATGDLKEIRSTHDEMDG